jgi:lipopolysaccharide/colanic/teichoic acid biosynthesis glycosyltransferase
MEPTKEVSFSGEQTNTSTTALQEHTTPQSTKNYKKRAVFWLTAPCAALVLVSFLLFINRFIHFTVVNSIIDLASWPLLGFGLLALFPGIVYGIVLQRRVDAQQSPNRLTQPPGPRKGPSKGFLITIGIILGIPLVTVILPLVLYIILLIILGIGGAYSH